MRFHVLSASAILFLATGCGGTPASDSAATADTEVAEVQPAVRIVSPANGDTVSQPFTVSLEAIGVELAPAGTMDEGKGHHHLVIDIDVPPDSLPLPPAPVVIHMGDASSERVIEGLKPGTHRIIAVLADGAHVPMTSVKQDTITVVVR